MFSVIIAKCNYWHLLHQAVKARLGKPLENSGKLLEHQALLNVLVKNYPLLAQGVDYWIFDLRAKDR
jgi:hypothetical protein